MLDNHIPLSAAVRILIIIVVANGQIGLTAGLQHPISAAKNSKATSITYVMQLSLYIYDNQNQTKYALGTSYILTVFKYLSFFADK